MLNGKNIILIGGTGSFGNKLVETVLDRYEPAKLIIFSRGEYKQYEMAQRFSRSDHRCLRYFIGDVRDLERLHRAFKDMDIVVNAAALKHVPIAEYNPEEAIKTNVMGAMNIVNAAIDAGVNKIMNLSTDKATNPINLYGATKLCADKLFIAGNNLVGRQDTAFSVVRYGNVLGSSGSVIPFFRKMRETGRLPVTDPRMTRFWISLQDGVDFVLDCLERMVGGEIFIPKLPSTSIVDLAGAIAPECEIEVVGIRPGEKLHEVLVPEDEARCTVEHEGHFVIKPDFEFFKRRFKADEYKPVPESFSYDSYTNPWKLSVEEIKEVLVKNSL